MTFTFLGTGTSHGVPVIGCNCHVCSSKDIRDNRLRASGLISDNNLSVLIDVGPEFRIQALKNNIHHLDAVLLTHGHADHLNGIDDLRIFSHTSKDDCSPIAENNDLHIYADSYTINDFRLRFSYIFEPTQEGGGKPRFNVINNNTFTKTNPLIINNCNNTKSITFVPVPIMHGLLPVSGWLIQNKLAYLTDCNYISPESASIVNGVEHLIIDGLRKKPHSTHFSFNEALSFADSISAKNVYLTHICHDFTYIEIQEYLQNEKLKYTNLSPENIKVSVAYDGQKIEF